MRAKLTKIKCAGLRESSSDLRSLSEGAKGQIMDYTRLISMSAAVLLTSGVFVLVAPPAYSKAGPVVVTANPNLVTRHVGFADLNLASAAGEQTLNDRVRGAI